MDATSNQPAVRYEFIAGNLCLDFTNTADWHESEQPVEWLTSFSDLLIWGQEAGVIDADDARWLLRTAEDDPESAVAVYARAITLREALFRIFRKVARQQPVEHDDLDLLNRELSRAYQYRRLHELADGYGWEWSHQGGELDRPLWVVALSAAELLTSTELSRVRQCAGDPCGWLFYDASRNRSRRWCNMDVCGNRAKARRHYERQKTHRQQTEQVIML